MHIRELERVYQNPDDPFSIPLKLEMDGDLLAIHYPERVGVLWDILREFPAKRAAVALDEFQAALTAYKEALAGDGSLAEVQALGAVVEETSAAYRKARLMGVTVS